MVKVSDVYGGNYVTAAELPTARHVLAEIAAAIAETVGRDQTVKLVLDLRSRDGRPWPRRLVLNKGNGLILASAYGDDTNDWIGKAIELWSEPTQFQGKDMMGVRLAAVGNGAVSATPLPPNGPQWNSHQPQQLLEDEIPF